MCLPGTDSLVKEQFGVLKSSGSGEELNECVGTILLLKVNVNTWLMLCDNQMFLGKKPITARNITNLAV